MKAQVDKLKELRGKIVGLEMNLAMIERDLVVLNNDVKMLCKLEKDYVANINILKGKNVIASASEYKKITRELSITKKGIAQFKTMKEELEGEYLSTALSHKQSLEEYRELEEEIKGCKVILLFDPSRRKSER